MLKKGAHNLTGNERYEGYAVELTQRISQILGFSYEIYIVPDGMFGAPQGDGHWNGIIGELLKGVCVRKYETYSFMFINNMRSLPVYIYYGAFPNYLGSMKWKSICRG